jgi:hypothetical protein
VDGPQAGIPRASAVFPRAFQVIEEVANEWCVEVFDPQLGGTLAESFFGKLKKRAEAVAISRYRMWACLPLAKQVVGKEALKQGGKAGGNHGCNSRWISRSVAS